MLPFQLLTVSSGLTVRDITFKQAQVQNAVMLSSYICGSSVWKDNKCKYCLAARM